MLGVSVLSLTYILSICSIVVFEYVYLVCLYEYEYIVLC